MYEDVTFRKGCMAIRGRLFRPEGAEKNVPLVIFSHGFGGHFSDLEHYGPVLADSGIACLFFDFCGGGPDSLSDGRMQDMSVLTEYEDLDTVLTEAGKLPGIDSERICLIGESQGGYVSALTAARRPEAVRGLILWYPAFVIEDDCRQRLRMQDPQRHTFVDLHFGEVYITDALKLDIYAEIVKYEKPVLILHGDCDDLVPLSYSERAARVYAHAKLKVLHGAGHGFEGKECGQAIEASIQFIMSVFFE